MGSTLETGSSQQLTTTFLWLLLRFNPQSWMMSESDHYDGDVGLSRNPEVTLDNFGFPVGGRLAALRAVFRPPGRILAFFDGGRNAFWSTPNFGPRSTKLGWNTRGTKKMIWGANGAGPDRNYGETAVFAFGRKAKNGPKSVFCYSNHPKLAKRLIYVYLFILRSVEETAIILMVGHLVRSRGGRPAPSPLSLRVVESESVLSW